MKQKGRNKGKRQFGNKSRNKKTYSLYGNNNKKSKNGHGSHKRKFNDSKSNNQQFKRQKLEEQVIRPVHQVKEEESEDSEQEFVDPMKQLRDALKTTSKSSQAIDSSSDDTEEEEEDDERIEEEEDAEDIEELGEQDEESEDEDDNEDKDEEDIEDEEEAENIIKIKKTKTGSKLEEDEQEEKDEIELEDEEGEIDIDTQKEDSGTKISADPFTRHVCYEISESLLESVQSNPQNVETFVEKWPVLGKLSIQIPKCDDSIQSKNKNNGFSIEKENITAPAGEIPKRIKLNSETTLDSLCIKQQIRDNLRKANYTILEEDFKCQLPFNDFQAELFSIINNYQDLHFPQRTFENAEQIRFVYCLHAANHILKTRTKVLHHNARLSSKDDVPEEFRDQGLVRPKILIIAPFRDSAYKIINTLINIFYKEDNGNVQKRNRFVEDFTGHEISMPKKNPKPEDYEQLFTGNTSDDFKIGITLTKKSIKLYADFYSSDIIIASPLGLRVTIGAEGEAERNFDFLASIELLIFDQMDVFLMQNFFHIMHVMDHMHIQPKDSHGTDFSRVRHWSLNGWAKYYRQTLIFSKMVIPEANSIFSNYCFNYAGKVNVVNPITNGAIKQVLVSLPHVYQKFSTASLVEAIESRFNYFINKILPQHKDPLMKQTLIFIPSYYDFVKIRNYFKREDISFVQICEYSKEAKVARARDMFFHGDAHFLLYTERFHFFNRVKLKGIRHIIFYQPPAFSHFYSEMCNFMMECNMNKKVGSMLNMTVTVLYSKYDGHQLASIVGTERAAKMLQADTNVHKILTK